MKVAKEVGGATPGMGHSSHSGLQPGSSIEEGCAVRVGRWATGKLVQNRRGREHGPNEAASSRTGWQPSGGDGVLLSWSHLYVLEDEEDSGCMPEEVVE